MAEEAEENVPGGTGSTPAFLPILLNKVGTSVWQNGDGTADFLSGEGRKGRGYPVIFWNKTPANS